MHRRYPDCVGACTGHVPQSVEKRRKRQAAPRDVQRNPENLRPYMYHIRDGSSDGILGNDAEFTGRQFDLPFRIIGNPWNEVNTGPYVIAVYRGRTSVLPGDHTENIAIGDWITNWGGIVPGTYKASLVEDILSVRLLRQACEQLQIDIDVANLIPDSVLIAWYVD